MEIVETVETYSPYMHSNGTYVDKIPNNINRCGIICNCGTRKETTTFYTKTALATHFTTKKHKDWLNDINNNKINYYLEYMKSSNHNKL
jgi:hypothetical protein